jgi:hypothetical protein
MQAYFKSLAEVDNRFFILLSNGRNAILQNNKGAERKSY